MRSRDRIHGRIRSPACTVTALSAINQKKVNTMKQTFSKPPRHRSTGVNILATLVVAGAAFGVVALFVNIMERKEEAHNPFYRVVELSDTTEDPVVWGSNFPLQYDGYTRTVDQIRTRFGGSESIQKTPTHADPRSVVAQSRLEQDPRLKTMWAGYAFAADFRTPT